MTPPDSGERCCDLADKGHRAGCPGKPDSDERGVLCVCGEDPVSMDGLCRDCWLGLCGCTEAMHPPRKWEIDAASVDLLFPEGKTPVAISLDLAQRILAALEDIDTQDVRAIRAELRARMPK